MLQLLNMNPTKQFFLLSFLFLLLVLKTSSQNIELAGCPIEITLNGYKAGQIQWQSSEDKTNWADIINQTTPKLNCIINNSGYFRAKITTCDSIYYSGNNYIMSLKINDELYKKNLDPTFKLNEIVWCNVPVPKDYKQSQTHPSIIYCDKNWNGYNIWLATSPYPSTDSYFENPCIYYSNYSDHKLNTNFNPIRNNPIDKINIRSEGFNADPEIFLDDSILFCIGKKFLISDKKYHYFLQKSENGQEWTKPKELFNSDLTGCEIVSPSLIKYKNKYRIYGAYSNALKDNGVFKNFVILESNSLENPDFKIISKPTFAKKGNIELWHFDLFEYNNLLYMVLCGKNTSLNYLSTYLAISFDYENFYIFPKPLFNEIYSYRPTAFIDDIGRFNLIISTMDLKHRIYSFDGNEIGFLSMPFTSLLELLTE